jgi:hypothetical protein
MTHTQMIRDIDTTAVGWNEHTAHLGSKLKKRCERSAKHYSDSRQGQCRYCPLLKAHKHNDAPNDIIQRINRAPPNADVYVSCHARMEKPMIINNAKGAVKIIDALSDGSDLWRNAMQDNKVKPLVEGKPNDTKRTYAQRNTEDCDKQHPSKRQRTE